MKPKNYTLAHICDYYPLFYETVPGTLGLSWLIQYLPSMRKTLDLIPEQDMIVHAYNLNTLEVEKDQELSVSSATWSLRLGWLT